MVVDVVDGVDDAGVAEEVAFRRGHAVDGFE